jgi:SAM-dependent methyltransferase
MQTNRKSPAELYGQRFHEDRDATTALTATTILARLFEWTEITSVCDVGCGVGTWLAAAQKLGAESIVGYEGPWVAQASLVVEPGVVRHCDLEQRIVADRHFDLVISLEVAEHLTPGRASGFVTDLCRLGDTVLFSAAIPNQGGTGHKNEQWQSYWAAHFDQEGFDAVDAIRPMVWNNDSVPWWYRQNTILYVRRGSSAANALASISIPSQTYVDLVHPELFSLGQEKAMTRALRRMATRLLGRPV